ncbi:MAG: Holliday junction resolvase-like protein [Thermoplasmatota archaeon]
MSGAFSIFVREQNHIFSVCPKCKTPNKLSDLQLSKQGAYQKDVFEKIDEKIDRIEAKKTDLESHADEIRAAARARYERKQLTAEMIRVAPSFVRRKVDPRDVRALFEPVDYIVFDGLAVDQVDRVRILSSKKSAASRSIEAAVKQKKVAWNTIRLLDDGSLKCSGRGAELPFRLLTK